MYAQDSHEVPTVPHSHLTVGFPCDLPSASTRHRWRRLPRGLLARPASAHVPARPALRGGRVARNASTSMRAKPPNGKPVPLTFSGRVTSSKTRAAQRTGILAAETRPRPPSRREMPNRRANCG